MRSTALVTAVLLGAALVVSAPPTVAAPSTETCQGVAATIVGTPGVTAFGTVGPDVVVSNGATGVLTYAGDDVVCVTGTSPTFDDYVYVNVADGNDRVDTTGDVHDTQTALGPGEDVFTGGSGHDGVLAGDDGDGKLVATEGRDVIRTGAGNDAVTAFSYTLPDHDDVDLGEGDDYVSVNSRIAPDTRIAGGEGLDMFSIADLDVGRWVFDNRAGGAHRAGQAWVQWSSLESFVFNGNTDSHARLNFFGGPADEHVEVWTDVAGTVAMGGGDDSVLLVSQRLAKGTVLTGGPGHDLLEATPYRLRLSAQGIEADMPGHRLRYIYPRAKPHAVPMRGFEDLRVSAPFARVAGDGTDNVLTISACNVEADGGPGADVIHWARDYRLCGRPGKPEPRIVLRGNGGDDELTGGDFDDVLLGGAGADSAWGKKGTDRCQAEVTRGCEVTAP